MTRHHARKPGEVAVAEVVEVERSGRDQVDAAARPSGKHRHGEALTRPYFDRLFTTAVVELLVEVQLAEDRPDLRRQADASGRHGLPVDRLDADPVDAQWDGDPVLAI